MDIITAAVVGSILLPPATIDHPPPATMLVVVREYPLEQVGAACVALGQIEPGALACSLRLGEGACIQILPKIGPGGVSTRDRALLKRHEDGHCNQERGSHEGWK